MSNDILPFNYEGAEVRTLIRNDDPWFVLRDVLNVLGVGNATEAIRSLDDDEFSTTEVVDFSGRRQPSAYIVSEAGLYSLILRSRKPQAKKFKRWVTHVVLPEIRKTGSYGQKALTPDEIVHQALQITAAKVQELEAKVAQDAPKVEYVDTFVARDDCRTFADLAKSLGLSESYIRSELLKRGWIFKKFIGERFSSKQQRKVEEWEYRNSAGHKEKFRLYPQHNAPRHHNNQYRQTLYVTPYGAQQIAKLLGVAAVTGPVVEAVA